VLILTSDTAAVAEKTPSSRELDELADQLRRVDSADQRLDKSNVRIWFQNRRREQKQLQLSSSSTTTPSTSSSEAAAERLTADVIQGHHWPGHHQWSASRDEVVAAVTRLARYCSTPTDITNTRHSYRPPLHSVDNILYSTR